MSAGVVGHGRQTGFELLRLTLDARGSFARVTCRSSSTDQKVIETIFGREQTVEQEPDLFLPQFITFNVPESTNAHGLAIINAVSVHFRVARFVPSNLK